MFLSISYFYSPITFPGLPICLANDAFYYFNEMSVECINWQPIFGSETVTWRCSLSVEQCYNFKTQDFTPLSAYSDGVCPKGDYQLGPNQRWFPDCAETPYNYDSPLKPLFTGLELIWPDFNSFIRNTQSPTLRYIRQIPSVQEGLNNETIIVNGTIPQDQLACLIIAGGGSIGSIVIVILLFAIATIFFIFLAQLLGKAIQVIVLTPTVISVPVSEFTTQAAKSSAEYTAKNTRDYQTLLPSVRRSGAETVIFMDQNVISNKNQKSSGNNNISPVKTFSISQNESKLPILSKKSVMTLSFIKKMNLSQQQQQDDNSTNAQKLSDKNE